MEVDHEKDATTNLQTDVTTEVLISVNAALAAVLSVDELNVLFK